MKETCNSNDISCLRYLFDDSYVFKCKKKLTNFQCDGIIPVLSIYCDIVLYCILFILYVMEVRTK